MSRKTGNRKLHRTIPIVIGAGKTTRIPIQP